jgi:hypothetical protein
MIATELGNAQHVSDAKLNRREGVRMRKSFSLNDLGSYLAYRIESGGDTPFYN